MLAAGGADRRGIVRVLGEDRLVIFRVPRGRGDDRLQLGCRERFRRRKLRRIDGHGAMLETTSAGMNTQV